MNDLEARLRLQSVELIPVDLFMGVQISYCQQIADEIFVECVCVASSKNYWMI